MGKENREVKNSVLVDLFCDDETAEKNDIELFNALHEESLPEGTKIERIRVDNVLYMDFQNDVSFGVEGKVLVMGEHQSTINHNMPLRSLMYIGRAYEKIVPTRDRYKRGLVKLPKPEFYTFYNGTSKMKAEKTLYLSDAYKIKDGDPMLELKVRVININSAANHEILEKCQVLKEYSQFIDTIRKYQTLGTEDPYGHAINECIEKGILAEYLERKGSEVRNMLVAEYDYNLDIEVQREEAMEDGIQIGEERGIQIGEERGRTEGNILRVINQVIKKISKGCTVAETADMLEEEPTMIQRIYDVAKKYAPEYDAEKIYAEL